MQIRSLKLLNFRNYGHLEIGFVDTNNIIYGNNGMGKTNLIEAIYVLALTKSFRGSWDKVVIKNDKNLTKISGIVKDNIENNYQLIISDLGKDVRIDNNKINKLSDYISKINVILFNPDDLRIIKDTPSIRRTALNIDISQLNNNYLKLINSYNKLLKQRNAYLKTMYYNHNTSSNYLGIITDKLIDTGIKICEERTDYIHKINTYIVDKYKKICGIDTISVNYQSQYANKSKDNIKEIYDKYLEKDMLLGKTLIGIHHDDIIFKLADIELKDYGSEGQQKNAIIAYKLAEIELFKELNKSLPILILDDLFSELDQEKINNILGLLDSKIQTFITTTDISLLAENVKKNSKIFKICDGLIEEDLR